MDDVDPRFSKILLVQAALGAALNLTDSYYLAAAWAVRRSRFRYLLYTLPFAAALYAGLKSG